MNKITRPVFLLLLSLASLGCVEYPYKSGSGLTLKPSGFVPLFNPEKPAVLLHRKVLLSEEDLLIEEIQFDAFSARYWHPLTQSPAPAILLLPGIWGDRVIEAFAQDLASKGFTILQLNSSRYLERIRRMSKMKTDSIAEIIRLQVIETGQAFEWLSRQPEIDADRIGILGISIGAIIATLFTETEKNIQAASYLLGGGNLSEIMSSPKGYVKRRLRERIMHENGISEAEFKLETARILQAVVSPQLHRTF